MSGADSANIADRLGTELKGFEFSANDIVIIDHSVNDAEVHFGGGKEMTLRVGFESLIRRILHFSGGNWPVMIVIEQYPYAFHDVPPG